MKRRAAVAMLLIVASTSVGNAQLTKQSQADSLALVQMVADRENAMNHRDMQTLLSQYSDDFTFINTAGSYLTRPDMPKFDSVLYAYDSTRYRGGKVNVRLLDSTNALVYYAWQVDRYRAVNPLLNEIGLMTLSAQKRSGRWVWVAMTNQSTPRFIEDVVKNRRYPQNRASPPPPETNK